MKEKVLCPFIFPEMERTNFIDAIREHGPKFGLDISDTSVECLAGYYELVQKYNPLLHLVGPCSAEEFAIRHILESLSLLRHLPVNSKFVDVGAGAGLPSIPCLIVRDDVRATLIESKEKKANFLNAAIVELGLHERASVINRQFEETSPGDAEFVTCRALDKFSEKLPRLLKWSKGRKLLLFGGPNLKEALQTNRVAFYERLIPLSDQRFLYVSKTAR